MIIFLEDILIIVLIRNLLKEKMGVIIYHKKDNVWIDSMGRIVDDKYPILIKGNTSNRPVLQVSDSNFQYFDTTLNKPIWWTGSKWVDATGADV